MEIDKETKLSHFWIALADTPENLKVLRETDRMQGKSKDEQKQLLVTPDNVTYEPEEFYFDANQNTIEINGAIRSNTGDGYISIVIPLSDTVLLDIVAHMIKKLNKLKTAMESLK